MSKYIPTNTKHPRFKNLTGQRFGLWTAKELLGSYDAKPYYLCACDCGRVSEVAGASLTKGESLSCGCRNHKVGAESFNYKHGGEKTLEYRVWKGMKARCLNPNMPQFPDYGGRGIGVCDRWLDFKNFQADMGSKPSPKHSLERIDNDGDYCPKNCKWATKTEQDINKRSTKLIEYQGEILPLFVWERRLGVGRWAIGQRLAAGWSVERAFTQPFQNRESSGK